MIPAQQTEESYPDTNRVRRELEETQGERE